MEDNNSYNISDIKQPVQVNNKIKGTLDGIQGIIYKLGFNDLTELINSEYGVNIDLSSVPKDEVVMLLKDIKKKWSRVSSSNMEKRDIKTNIDRMCSGMISFFKKYEISDYLQYLENSEIYK